MDIGKYRKIVAERLNSEPIENIEVSVEKAKHADGSEQDHFIITADIPSRKHAGRGDWKVGAWFLIPDKARTYIDDFVTCRIPNACRALSKQLESEAANAGVGRDA